MATTQKPWAVREHTPLTQIDDNFWAIEDFMPNRIHRRMSIIRRSDGGLVFFNAIPVDDATLAAIRALGIPQCLLVGHHQHMSDVHAFQQKLGLKVYGPKATEMHIKKRVDMEGTLEDVPKDSVFEAFSMPGSKLGEAIVFVKSGNGARTSVLVSDVLQNTPPEVLPFYFRWLGFSGGPKMVPAYRMLFASDKSAIKKEILRWADMPSLKRLVPFHGDIVEDDVVAKLKQAASNI